MFKLINRVGVELEGGWDKQRNDLVPDAGIRADEFKKSACCGELVSKPIDNYEACKDFIKENWPTETNDMSGFHIHVSFKDITSYVVLMNKNFRKYFVEYMKKWGEAYPINNNQFWERLENKNKFCKDDYREDQIFLKQKKPNDPGRYTQIHYAYGLHKTVEFRLLPTFVSVDTALAGFKATIDCVESYLELNPPKPFNFAIEETIEENAHPDEQIDLNVGGIIGKKKINKVLPFNIFIEKGMVPPCKYDMASFYKNDKTPPPEMKSLRKNKGSILLKSGSSNLTAYSSMPIDEEPEPEKATYVTSSWNAPL